VSDLVIDTVPPLAEAESAPGLLAWVTTVDHKKLGIMYLLTAVLFLAVAGAEALLMRIQLAFPNNHLLAPDVYNQILTMHGTTMIFLVATPAVVGFATYLIPLMIGARDMAFPRLNAMAFWITLFGGLMLNFSFFAGHAPAAGWFTYPPLSEHAYSTSYGVDYYVLALFATGIGTISAAINFIVTTAAYRAPGMRITQLPLFVWMMMVVSFLILSAMPPFNAAIAMLEIDRQFGAHFFTPSSGGSALFFQHAFWAFGHPEVYILMVPAFGMVSEVIPVFSRKPIFGYEFVAGSTVAIGFLSLAVWAHHMFAVGMGHLYDGFFMLATMAISVPTGIKIFNWSVTMWGGSIRLTTSMYNALAFILMFTIGGLTGITLAMVPLDWQLTDSYYLVAHFHYTAFGGVVFGLFAGTYYWFPKISGRMLSERWGKLSFWLVFIGFNLTFMIQHLLGLMGMPRRVFTYPDLPGWAVCNMISTIGAFVMGLGILVFLYNVITSLLYGEPAGDNPWNAWTLEWATTSPPPEENFKLVPPVRSRRPLWDLANPERADYLVRK